jgi:hypothetical protein
MIQFICIIGMAIAALTHNLNLTVYFGLFAIYLAIKQLGG